MWVVELLFFGLVIGVLARMLHPGRDKMNLFWTILLGVWGSILGGWIGSLLSIDVDEGFRRWIAATLGALFLLIVYSALVHRKPNEQATEVRRRPWPFRRTP